MHLLLRTLTCDNGIKELDMEKQASGSKVDPFKKFGTHAVDMRVALNKINPALAYKVGNMEWLMR